MKLFLFSTVGCLMLALFTAVSYTADGPLPTTVLQEAPYKVVKDGIYLKAGLAIAFSNKRSALVYDPATYVAVESGGQFMAVHRKEYNNTDCDCGRNQVCVNGECKDVPKVAVRPGSDRGNLHVNGQSWSRAKSCSASKVRVQGTCGSSTSYNEDLCGDQCPKGEVCVRDHGSGDRICVPFRGIDKIAGILQIVSW